MSDTYTNNFYDTIRPGCQSSAAAVAPVVHDIFKPETVIDVGCGEGWWAMAFADLGCDVKGIDGAYVESSPLGDRFIAADISQPFQAGNYDLAVCLEVAEHLPESRAASFISDLCELAPVVVFSAAIPGQTGAGHINCQWPTYWANLFAAKGYKCSGALRWLMWNDDHVEPWYRQNLIVATNESQSTKLKGDSPPASVVHPVIYGWHYND